MCDLEERVCDPELYSIALALEPHGDEEAAWLQRQVAAFWDRAGDYECVDNTRLARSGDPAEVCAYEAAREGGCCGSEDVELGPSPRGHVYLYGFNHGH